VRNSAFLTLTVLASACGEARVPSAGNDVTRADALPSPAIAQPVAAPPVKSPPPDVANAEVVLAGAWRVAGIDAKPLEADYGIALSASDHYIWWEPGCAGQGRFFTVTGNRFRHVPTPDPTIAQRLCEIAPPLELAAIWRAIEHADRIERTPQNGILISGGGHSVLLFSQ
jgi:hypothetical protein